MLMVLQLKGIYLLLVEASLVKYSWNQRKRAY